MALTPRFSTEQKIFLFFLFYIYSVFIISFVFLPLWGWGVTAFLDLSSIPLMQLTIYIYRLNMFKKSREEVEGFKWMSATIIDANGEWHSIEFGIVGKPEHMDITDQRMSDYENRYKFKKSLETVKKENPILDELNDDELNDEFVDVELSKDYEDVGLSTSRQIYCYELIKKFVNDQKEWTKLLDELKKIDAKDIGLKTETLEKAMIKLKISEDLVRKLIAQENFYYDHTLRLEDVYQVKRESVGKKPLIKQQSVPLIMFFILFLITSITFGYISSILNPSSYSDKSPSLSEVYVNISSIINTITVISVVILIINIVAFLLSIRKMSQTMSEPYKIVIQNKVVDKDYEDVLCYLRKRVFEFVSDGYIYRITPLQDDKEVLPKDRKFGRIWKSDTIYYITPASFGDSFNFDISYIYHKSQSVPVNMANVVMTEIGKIYGSEPIYLILDCDYTIEKRTKVYYNFNLLQSWKIKAYLYRISELEADVNMLTPEARALKIRADKWKVFATTQAQLFLTDSNTRQRELRKSPYNGMQNAQEEYVQQQYQNEEEMIAQQKAIRRSRLIKIIATIVVITIIIVFIVTVVVIMNGNGIDTTTNGEVVNA